MPAEIETTKWLNGQTRQRAARRAQRRAGAQRWTRSSVIFAFAVFAVMLVLALFGVSDWVKIPVAISGITVLWIIGWRKEKELFPGFLDEELAKSPDDWKDYYKILRVSPNAKPELVAESYQHLSHIFREGLTRKAQTLPLYSNMIDEIEEAHRVLSDPAARAAYDQIFWMHYNSRPSGIDDPTKHEILMLSQFIITRVSEAIKEIKWKLPSLKVPRAVVLGTLVVLCSVLLGGTSLAFARPQSALAKPFVSMAISLTETTGGAVGLIGNIRSVAATYERSIISSSLQAMRLDENLKQLPVIITPTNDLSIFPAPEHPLFPEYIDRQYSQFKYTVDSKGNVTVDKSWAATDAFLEKITRMLERLEAKEHE
jgi:curved DNA-binding protein CbpA